MTAREFLRDVIIVSEMLAEVSEADKNDRKSARRIRSIANEVIDAMCVEFTIPYRDVLDEALVRAPIIQYALRYRREHGEWPDDGPFTGDTR